MSWSITPSRAVAAGLFTLSIGIAGFALSAEEKKAKSSPEDEVKAVEMARGEALMKADTLALARMTADEFFEITRFATIRGKTDNIRDVGSGALQIKTFKLDSLAVKVYGDVAILRGVTDNTGVYHGFPFAGKIRYMRIFVKRDGRWQAVAMQHTPMQ